MNAFEDIPRLHGPALYRLAVSLTGNRAAAHDLVQDTYERALRRGLDRVPPERLRGWLFVIARNRFLDEARRGLDRRLTPFDEDALVPDDGPELDREGNDPLQMLGLDDLRRAVEGLHPRLAEPYRLFAFDGMDYAEISARLRIPVPTVGTRLLRARRKLRDALSRPEGACTPLVAKRPRPQTTVVAFAA